MANENVDDLDGHETVFMDSLCQEIRRRAIGNDEPIILDEFLDKHFSGGGPHGFMLDRIPRLANRGLIERNERTVRLTQRGLAHCNTNVR